MHDNEKWKWSRSVVSNSSWPHGLQPTRLLRPWDFLGKSTGVGCHCLLPRVLINQFCFLKTVKVTLFIPMKVKICQSYPTPCDHMDYPVHGILQARILVWVAVAFSRGSSQPRDWTQVSCIAGGFFTRWAIQGKPKNFGVGTISSPGDLPNPGIEPGSLALQEESLSMRHEGSHLFIYSNEIQVIITTVVVMYQRHFPLEIAMNPNHMEPHISSSFS